MHNMMGHSQTLFQNHFAGNLANKIKDTMSCVPDLLKVVINHFYSHLLACLIAVFALASINYMFAYLMAAWLVIFIGGSILLSKRANHLSNVAAEVRSRVMGQFVDILTNMLNVHLFSAKKTETKKLETHLYDFVKSDQKRDWWFLYMSFFQGSSFLIYQAIAFVLLGSEFKQGRVTAGDFVMLLTLNTSIVNLLWTISEDLLRVSEFVGNIRQGLSIAMMPHDSVDVPHATPLVVARGEIIFDKVHFNYKGADPLFNNKSISDSVNSMFKYVANLEISECGSEINFSLRINKV
jgi:ATP-binding cassette subfamily B protein